MAIMVPPMPRIKRMGDVDKYIVVDRPYGKYLLPRRIDGKWTRHYARLQYRESNWKTEERKYESHLKPIYVSDKTLFQLTLRGYLNIDESRHVKRFGIFTHNATDLWDKLKNYENFDNIKIP